MELLVDIGNEKTALAEWKGDVKDRVSASTHFSSPKALQEWLLKCKLVNTPDSVWVASVVPEVHDLWESVVRELWGIEVEYVSTQTAPKAFEWDVDNPDGVGADRIANAIGAWTEFKRDVVVMDFGTATTFDIMTKDRVFRGGFILAGIAPSLNAMAQSTSKLPHVRMGYREFSIGKNTTDAMVLGTLWGHVAQAEGLMSRLSKILDKPQFVVTGGWGEIISRALNRSDIIFDPFITLKGIHYVFGRSNA